jgi:hypothetical protein
MAEHPNLSILMEHFRLSEHDCSLEVTDVHAEKISSSFCSKWKSLPPYLEIEDIVAKDINRCLVDESDKRHLFLKKWKEMKGSEATYRKLINALLEVKCRQDAERVCKLLQNKSTSPSLQEEPRQPVTSPRHDEPHTEGMYYYAYHYAMGNVGLWITESVSQVATGDSNSWP